MWENIFVTSDSCMFPGLIERLHTELAATAPTGTVIIYFSNVILLNTFVQKINIHSHPERTYLAWLGGSQFAMSSGLSWVTREEYKSTVLNKLSKPNVFLYLLHLQIPKLKHHNPPCLL